MSQYQRQRLSEEDFQRQVEEYYKAKEAYNEIVSKLPIMPDDQGDTGEHLYLSVSKSIHWILVTEGIIPTKSRRARPPSNRLPMKPHSKPKQRHKTTKLARSVSPPLYYQKADTSS